MRKTKHYYRIPIYLAIALIVACAWHIGDLRQTAYEIDHQEELRRTYERGYFDGYKSRQEQLFDEIAEIAGEIHDG